MANLDFEYFKKAIHKRLKDIQHQNESPERISRLIKPIDLENIYTYLFEDEDKMNELPLGGVLRIAKGSIDKDKNIPARTLAVTRDLDGKFSLILETKSKLADGQKKTPKIFTGAFKKGKPSWRIDTEIPEPYISMVTYVVFEHEQTSILHESKVHELFKSHSENINYSFMSDYNAPSKEFENKVILKVCQYSPLAYDNLYNFVRKNKLTPDVKNHIRYQLLKGLEVLHDLNIAHQDIKAPNVLVYLLYDSDPNPAVHVKITDFGISTQHQSNDIPFSTLQYESPEISLIHSDTNYNFFEHGKKVSYKGYYNNADFSTLGRDYRDLINNNTGTTSPLQTLPSYTPEQISTFTKPDKANDIWALGVLLHYVEFGYLPVLNKNEIHKDPLIKALLDPNRETRLDIKKAIALHNTLTLKSPFRDSPATLPGSPTTETPEAALKNLISSKLREPMSSSEPQVKIEVPIPVKSEFILAGKNNVTEQVILHHALSNQLKDTLISFMKFSQRPEYDPINIHRHFHNLMQQMTKFEQDVSQIDLKSPNLAKTLKQKYKQAKEMLSIFEEQVPTVHFSDPFKSTHNQICSLQRNLEGWSRQYKSPVADIIINSPGQAVSPSAENKNKDDQNQFKAKQSLAKEKNVEPNALSNAAPVSMPANTAYVPHFSQTHSNTATNATIQRSKSRMNVNVANESKRADPKI